MDRFASNTLRTLAIIGAAVLVIVGSPVVLFIGFCFQAAATCRVPFHYDPSAMAIFYAAIILDAVFITGGILGIAR
jgi:hypothetical protein